MANRTSLCRYPQRLQEKPLFTVPAPTRSSQGQMTAFSCWRSQRQIHRDGPGELSYPARCNVWCNSRTAIVHCSSTQQKAIRLPLSVFQRNPNRNNAGKKLDRCSQQRTESRTILKPLQMSSPTLPPKEWPTVGPSATTSIVANYHCKYIVD